MEDNRLILQNPTTQDSNDHEDEVMDTLSLSDFMVYDTNGDPQDFDSQEFYRLNDRNNPINDQFEFSSELSRTSVDKSVVFCGKVIPYKEPIVVSQKVEKSQKQRWRLARFFKKSRKTKGEKVGLKYEVPRWYLLMFGFGSSSGLSAHMQIRDLKKRQTSIGVKDYDDKMKSGGHGGGDISGSWRLVKLLGCGGGGGGVRGGDSHRSNVIKNVE